MFRLFRHQLTQQYTSSGTDRIFGSMPIPSESSQNNVWGNIHVVDRFDSVVHQVSLYGIDGFLLAVPDPDSPDSVEDLWDRLVDKDDDITLGSLDLDEATSDLSNLYEAGEPSIGAIMDAHVYKDDNHWFKRRSMMSFASSPTGFNYAAAGNSTYLARDMFKLRSRKKIYTEYFSMSLLGISVPIVETKSTNPNAPTQSAWLQQKYLEVVLEQAWMTILGLTESGAESPWEEAAALVQELTEPDVEEATAGAFRNDSAMSIFSELTWDVSVPGRREIKVLTGAS